MEYDNIIKEIDNLNSLDFNMKSLQNIGVLSKTINTMYGNLLLKNKDDARANYEVVRGHLCSTLFDILKEKLGFESETINQIISLIDYIELVQEIYVVDGIVMVKLHTDPENKNTVTGFVPKESFINVTSRLFVSSLNMNVYKDYFIKAFNAASNEKLLDKENDMITYSKDNLNIYIDRPLKSIMQTNSDVIGEVVKVIIEDDDNIDYYDMRIRYGCFELIQNNFTINKVSEMLNNKSKTKKLGNK